MNEEQRQEMVVADVLHQKLLLEVQGFKVTLSDIYLARIGYAVDDWDFADCPDHTLIKIEKNGITVESSSEGQRSVVLRRVLDNGSTEEVQHWGNVLMPKAELLLFREFGDGQNFEFLNQTYCFSVYYNGWFCEDIFQNGEQMGDSTDAYYDPPMPKDIAGVYEEFVKNA